MVITRRSLLLSTIISLFSAPNAVADDPALPPGGTSKEEIVRSVGAGTVEALPGGILLLFAPICSQAVIETRHAGSYDTCACIYEPQLQRPQRMNRVVLLHFRNADSLIAWRVARLIGRLLRLYREHFGREIQFPNGSSVAEVWINSPSPSDSGDAGGEAWANQIYLYHTQMERSQVEWARTIAHEWGHLTLPAARGFSYPEHDAAGYLGERLYLKWLNEDRKTRADDFITYDGLTLYQHRQIAPLIADFQETGPGSPLIKQASGTGMDYYIGGALSIDESFGSRVLGNAIFSVENEQPRELFRVLRDTLKENKSFKVQVPAWVPLSAGDYWIGADGSGTVRIAEHPPIHVRSTPNPFHVRLSGWKRIERVAGEVQMLTIYRTRTGAKM